MPYSLGARSLGFCTHVDSRTMLVARAAIAISTQDFCFTEEQSRTLAYEAQLVAEGKSHTMKSHHIIGISPAWAEPGKSGAVDAVAWTGAAPSWDWARVWPIMLAWKRASIQLGIPITSGTCWDRLLSEIPGDTVQAMKAASDDYVVRRKRLGLGHFIDGPHFEYGRN